MKTLFLVFLGGGLGSVLRFIVGIYLNKPGPGLPYGTFAVNILGSLFMGIILGFTLKNTAVPPQQTIFLAIGFCGGFTTFSAFAYENYVFLKTGDFMIFAIYTIASFAVGLLAVFAGLYITKFLN